MFSLFWINPTDPSDGASDGAVTGNAGKNDDAGKADAFGVERNDSAFDVNTITTNGSERAAGSGDAENAENSSNTRNNTRNNTGNNTRNNTGNSVGNGTGNKGGNRAGNKGGNRAGNRAGNRSDTKTAGIDAESESGNDSLFPPELVDELALVRDALHFAVSWLGWRKWLRASGLLEWCSAGVLVPSGCGSFVPFWQYESDWLTYLSRLRLDRRRRTTAATNAGLSGETVSASPYVLSGGEQFSRADEDRITRLVMRRAWLERLEREWCRDNSYALRRDRPALLTFRSAKTGVPFEQPILYSEYARLSFDETRWYADKCDLIDFTARLVRTLVDRFGRIGVVAAHRSDPVIDAYLDNVTTVPLWRHKLDETLNTFDDETLDLMLRALAVCRSHRVRSVSVYSNTPSDRCPAAGTRLVPASTPTEGLRLGSWPALSFLLVDLHFVRISRQTLWGDTLRVFMGRFQGSIDSLTHELNDWMTVIPVPDVERDSIYIVRVDDDRVLASRLSHVLVARSDLRALLNYTFLPNERAVLYGGPSVAETAALSAIFSAQESRLALLKASAAPTDVDYSNGPSAEELSGSNQVCCDLREVLLRALQLCAVGVYSLRYTVAPLSTDESERASQERASRRASHDRLLSAFLRRSGAVRNRYFIDSGIERGTALTEAVLSFAAQRGLDRDVNRLRVDDVRAYASYNDLVAEDASRPEVGGAGFECVFVATSALLAVDGVEHFTRLANQQLRDSWPSCSRYGMFFRHEQYPDLHMLLLPAESSPVFDRVIDLPDLTHASAGANAIAAGAVVRATDVPSSGDIVSSTVVGCAGYLRLCFVKLRGAGSNEFSERALVNPAVIAALLREIVAHITMSEATERRSLAYSLSYSPLISVATAAVTKRNETNRNGSDRDGQAVDGAESMDGVEESTSLNERSRPSLHSLFDRDRIAAMVRIDPFLSISACRASVYDDVATRRISRLVSRLPRFFFPNCKLWRALDAMPVKCAFVRNSPVTYCPRLLFDGGLSLAQRGILPLEAACANDTWKLYLLDNVRSGKPMPCDRTYVGPPRSRDGDGAPLFYYEPCGESPDGDDASAGTFDRVVPPPPPVSGVDLSRERNADRTVVRLVDGQVSIGPVVPYFASKNAHGRDWMLYGLDNTLATFDSLVAALRIQQSLISAPVVRLINWDEHFPPGTPDRPLLQKLSAKRVYLVNGVLGFCEQQTKFVSASKVDRPTEPISPANFANALVRPGDSLCFHNTVDRVDPTVRIAPMHFYHRVYQSMVRAERHPIIGDGGYVDLRFRETDDYFVLVFQCTRIWFPRVDLLQRLAEAQTTCFGDTPRHLVPLVDFYARQALKRGR